MNKEQMKKDLEKIAIDLKKWCKKYDKDYVTACYVNNVAFANVEVEDEDHNFLSINIVGDSDE